MRKYSDLTGIILAGGKCRRMGSNKAMCEYNGLLLIEHSLKIINQLTDRIFISGQYDDYNRFDVLKVPDNYFDIGPIAGIEACLSKSETKNNLFVPCDTPLLSIELLNSILEDSSGFDAVVPILPDGKVEPLVAFYSRSILPFIHQQISAGDYQILSLLKKINTKYLAITDSGYFRNINTPEDLYELSKISPLISEMPNLLLLAGTGRNVGKTTLACEIISYFSKTHEVTGVKITHHSHPVETGQKIYTSGDGFIVVEEMLDSSKDSSRMKLAGAKKVFYIQTIPEKQSEAFNSIREEISTGPVVCESGGIGNFIVPGLFLFVKGDTVPENKKHYLSHNPVIVKFTNGISDINMTDLVFSDNVFFLNK